LIDLPCAKYARRTFAIVSTISIPASASKNHGSQCGPLVSGSRLDADHPENGVPIARRFTLRRVACGGATLGTVRFEGRFDYAAIGTVSNVASRLCDEAKPGQILISPRVLVVVENAVTVEPVGEFELKGIRRPLVAYNMVGAVSSER
jgi:class 3 adenylate cyclase